MNYYTIIIKQTKQNKTVLEASYNNNYLQPAESAGKVDTVKEWVYI